MDSNNGRVVIWSLVAIVCGGMLWAAFGDDTTAQHGMPRPADYDPTPPADLQADMAPEPPPKPRKPYVTTAIRLNADYAANEVAANMKINGAPVLVTGMIMSIDEDFTDDVVLKLLVDENPYDGARMHMEKSEKAQAATLSKGQEITVLCEKMMRSMGDPSGSECVIRHTGKPNNLAAQSAPSPEEPAQ